MLIISVYAQKSLMIMQIVLYCTYLEVVQNLFIIHSSVFHKSVGNDAGFWMLQINFLTENEYRMGNHIDLHKL